MKKADVGNPAPKGSKVQRHGGLVNVACRLTGIHPQSALLMNAMSEEELLKMRSKTKAAKTAAKAELREEAASKVYTLADGRPHVPVRNLFACFINAGQHVRLDGKRQVSTAKSTCLPGAMDILDAELPLFVPGTDDPATWEVDIMKGTNPNGGEAVCVVRPRFDLWEIRCTLQVDQSLMALSVAQSLVTIAGSRIGLGDFRPQRKGTFGRFTITLWEPQGE